MDRKYLDPNEPVQAHRRRLPHWQQGGAAYFVTWRLADALPQELLAHWEAQRATWLEHHPKPWSGADETEYHERFSQAIDRHLDAGHGECILRDPSLRQTVSEALLFFEGSRTSMWGFVVMPNHVHALFSLWDGHDLEKVMFSWKRFTAGKINEKRGEHGRVWQAEYFDRMIRHKDHFLGVLNYILENPVKARLRESEFLLWQRKEL